MLIFISFYSSCGQFLFIYRTITANILDTKRSLHLHIAIFYVVGPVGLEPTSLAATDFKSVAYTIPPRAQTLVVASLALF
jgi:hypothetical protein